jgi:putative polyketide hydroxylase
MPDTPVLIVGGGISGLSAAAFLSQLGVASVLVERRRGPATHPRMSDVGPRSMELFRGLGLEDRIRALDEGRSSLILRVDTLAGTELERHSMGGPEEFDGLTPTQQIWADQDQLEPIVQAFAEEKGTEIRTGVELVDLSQDETEVRAVVRDRTTGAEQTITASYLLACDGAQSPIREGLGIGMSGPGVLAHQAGILFRADLDAALRDRTFVLCLVDDLDDGGGTDGAGADHLHILLWRNLGRWTLSVPYDPERDRPEDFDDARCTELVRRAVGLPDLPVTVLGADIWPMRAMVADQFGSGRVFLLGDAAHVLPPTGGFGGNSSIDDAHNLAWKLASVLSGAAGPGLLDSYHVERQPMAGLHMGESLARAGLFLAGAAEGGSQQPANHPSKASIVLGYRYRAGALVPEPGDADDPRPVEDPFTPSGRPGTRAPHVVLDRDGETISTLDLFGAGFVLLAGPDGDAWVDGVDGLTVHVVGSPHLRDVAGSWAWTYGVTSAGAVLVRPDGYIAWRSPEAAAAPADALREALDGVLSPEPAGVVSS